MFNLDQIKGNITTVDRQLLLLIYEQQIETNRMLGLLTNDSKPEQDTPDESIERNTEELESLKRPELMKRMSKLSNSPQGWNRWETEKIRTHLKGVS